MPTIDRDIHGVPHIYGATEADAAFGFGYAQAEDHLPVMLRNYMEAAGRLAEIEGDAAVDTDVRTRLWRTVEKAEAAYPQLDPATRDYLDAFVAGVNRYIDEHPDDMPPWGERATPVAVIALYRLLHIRFNELTMPELAGMQDGALSNQWALAPGKTASGATLCVMDPHVYWIPVLRMYEAHLSGGGLNVYGVATVGTPTILLGHTGQHAWSFTINRSDISDLYVEQLDPADARRYRYEDGWRTMEERETVIRVRTDKGVREERRTLAWSHHGPVIARDGDNACAVRLSAYDIVDPITPFLGLARAQNLDAFKAALATLDIPMMNVLYGDAEGNLYYAYLERCPVRSEAYDWRQPAPGWTSETEWNGYLPFDRLPQTENPASGFLQNCNNAPWFVTPDSDIREEDFPSYAAGGIMTGRGRRLLAWLQGHDRITVEQALAMAMDEYNLTAEALKPGLLEAYTARWGLIDDPDGRLAQAAHILRDWNNVGDVDSRGMALFALWKMRYDAMLEGRTGNNKSEDEAQCMLDALRDTARYMIDTYGRLDVRWGDVHVLRRGGRDYPVGGSSPGTESLRPVRGALGDDGKMAASFGSAFTMVVELGDPVRAWSLVPYGNTDRPDSLHYDDQSGLWTQKRFKRAWFTREEVETHLESRVRIERISEYRGAACRAQHEAAKRLK